MSRLYIFDMDGTLLPGTTASLEIAKVKGTTRELAEIETSFRSAGLSTREFARRIHALWGVLDRATIRRAFGSSPKLEGIEAVARCIREEGGKSCVITLSPDFFAEELFELGFDRIFASGFPHTERETFNPERILRPEDKPRIAEQLCRELGFDLGATVAFGDSSSDLPLFERVGTTVSVNGDAEVERVAQFVYRGDDLREAFGLLDGRAESHHRDGPAPEVLW